MLLLLQRSYAISQQALKLWTLLPRIQMTFYKIFDALCWKMAEDSVLKLSHLQSWTLPAVRRCPRFKARLFGTQSSAIFQHSTSNEYFIKVLGNKVHSFKASYKECIKWHQNFNKPLFELSFQVNMLTSACINITHTLFKRNGTVCSGGSKLAAL